MDVSVSWKVKLDTVFPHEKLGFLQIFWLNASGFISGLTWLKA